MDYSKINKFLLPYVEAGKKASIRIQERENDYFIVASTFGVCIPKTNFVFDADRFTFGTSDFFKMLTGQFDLLAEAYLTKEAEIVYMGRKKVTLLKIADGCREAYINEELLKIFTDRSREQHIYLSDSDFPVIGITEDKNAELQAIILPFIKKGQ